MLMLHYEFTGVQEEKISYSIDIDEMHFTLFDDDAEGNGCCEAIWRHYQISNSAKAAAGEMRAPPPPRSDFLSKIEKRMLTCDEHVTHRLAFDLYNGEPIQEVIPVRNKPLTLCKNATQRCGRN